MGTLAWLTDPHFDMLSGQQVDTLVAKWASLDVDGLLITGDIADGETLLSFLTCLDSGLPYPIWFVLGNHDYYGTGIGRQRSAVRLWCQTSRRTTWLAESPHVALSKTVALVGHGGWADGGYGDFHGSSIGLNDYRQIAELTGHDKHDLIRRLTSLGQDAASVLKRQIISACKSHTHVLVATHVPPFVESCWYQGQATLNEWTPHFSCKSVGDCLLEMAAAHPDHTIHVYCGHTHSGGEAQLAPNLAVTTGGATYKQPTLQEHIHF